MVLDVVSAKKELSYFPSLENILLYEISSKSVETNTDEKCNRCTQNWIILPQPLQNNEKKSPLARFAHKATDEMFFIPI